MKIVAFGGGCHWCTEAIFQSLKGVDKVEQGWICSEAPHHAYSEAVIVHYSSDTISLETLIEVHLLTHSSTSTHPLRERYRSAIYFKDGETRDLSIRILNDLKLKDNRQYITLVLPLVDFNLNEGKYLDYYKRKPDAPFCKNYIDPKLMKLIKSHGEYLVNHTSKN